MQPQTPLNFNAFKDSFSQGVTFLKRRFSSTDQLDGQEVDPSAAPTLQRQESTRFGHSQEHLAANAKASFVTSAPTSPTRQSNAGSIMQGITKSIMNAAVPRQQSVTTKYESSKCILIIDNQSVDWSKYFRGRRVLGDYPVRVEQTDFSKIKLVAQSDPAGCVVELQGRSFRPDFVLVRQPVKEFQNDWRPVIVGLLYSAVPSLNTLHSVYNFADKPWVFSHLLMLKRRMGAEKFPLIEQLYSYRHSDLCSAVIRLPSVLKMGQAYGGEGKYKINCPEEMEDLSSLISVFPHYYTTEPFIDAKYDLVIHKIGPTCKAFLRKGMGQNWKTSAGPSMLEQIALSDKHKEWISEASKLFGGLDMCSVSAVVGKDGKESIYEMNDCTFPLLGDTQEEDRRQIVDLVIHKINHILNLRQAQQRMESMVSSPHNFIKHESPKMMARNDSVNNAEGPKVAPPQLPPAHHGPPPPVPARPATAPPIAAVQRQLSQQRSMSKEESVGIDDTMSSLKKTFAGIFGDM